MALNLISNYAASVAQRNLARTDERATASLSKLSSGTRVVSAKDDAASLAIGKSLEGTVAALKTAQGNASQAQSMLQIADGALSTIGDILTRMKALAVQASSGQLSSSERTFLNDEFVVLRSEIERIAQDTEFNGTALLNGSTSSSATTIGTNIQSADGFELFQFNTSADGTFVSTGDTLEIDYDASTDILTITNQVTSATQTVTGISTAPSAGSFDTIDFSDFGLSIKLNSLFATGTGVSANNEFIVAGGNSTTLQLTFRVGTGTGTNDEVTFNLSKARVAELATSLDTDTIDTVANAENTMGRLDTAINSVNGIRADVGGAQNRIGFAASNLAASVENTEAARSGLLDLNVAQEMTTFTSAQILLQAGVAMLAQANQLPGNLLKLLQ